MQSTDATIRSQLLPTDWFPLIGPRPGRRSLSQHPLTMLLWFALFMLALNLWGEAPLTAAERLLVNLTALFCALPIFLWLSGADKGIAFMPLYGFVFGLYYAFPMLLMRRVDQSPAGGTFDDSTLVKTFVLILMGFVMLLAGYYSAGFLLRRRRSFGFALRWRNCGSIKLWAIVLGLAGLAVYVVSHGSHRAEKATGSSSAAQFLVFASYLCDIGILPLFPLQLTGWLGWLGKAFLWGFLVPVRMAAGLATGLSGQAIGTVIPIVILYSSLRRRLPWAVIAAGFLGVMFVHSVEMPFRALTWKGGALSGASSAEKAELMGKLALRAANGGMPYEDLFQATLGRLNMATMFAMTVSETPSFVPYWQGATYYPILFKPIPRILYPEKPKEATGGAFGHRYNTLDPSDHETSINLPQLVELYINFGIAGVVVGMFLFGVLFQCVLSLFVHEGMGFGALIGASFIAAQFFNLESATSMMLGGVLWGVVFLGLLHLVFEEGDIRHMSQVRGSALSGSDA